jgi:hypothetical protein
VPDNDICGRSFGWSSGDGPTPQMAATSTSAGGAIVHLCFGAGGGPVVFAVGRFHPQPVVKVLLTVVVTSVKGGGVAVG